MADCSGFRILLGLSVYDDLESAERTQLDRHLVRCASCRKEQGELKRAADLLVPAETDLTAAEEARLAAGIARRLKPTRRRRTYASRRRWGPALVASAALAAAVLLAVFSFNQPEPETPTPTPVVKVVPKPASDAPTPVPIPRSTPIPSRAPKPDAGPLTNVVPPAPPPPAPPAPPKPEPEAKPVVPRRTIAVVGTLERVNGQVAVVKADGLQPAVAGMEIATGQALRTMGRDSLAILKYKDGTVVEIGPDTRVTEASAAGKKLHLERGEIRADVVPQPADRPLLVVTENAEARVLGTTFRFAVGAGASTLEVRTGKVRLTRTADGESVDVAAGHRARAKEGEKLEAIPSRITGGLVALYTFRENGGGIIRDVSATGLPLDLRIRSRGAATWSDAGLTVKPRPRITSGRPASKIIDACMKSGEVTLEAWLTPAQASVAFQGAIVALSRDVQIRNVALVQVRDRYEISARTSTTDDGGRPVLASAAGSTPVEPTHLVYTRAADGTERLYVNGLERSMGNRPGTFASWDAAYPLSLGDEPTEERPWEGTYRLVAVYARALSAEDVAHNFRMGAE